MKTIVTLIAALFLMGCNLQETPRIDQTKRINDLANVLTVQQTQQIETRLITLQKKEVELIVVILKKLPGNENIEGFSNDLFKKWGIGRKDKNNGLLLLASIEDRKVRLEVGGGFEGALTDIEASSILRTSFLPNFRNKNYFNGIVETISSIEKQLERSEK